jgi:hypothetical protein
MQTPDDAQDVQETVVVQNSESRDQWEWISGYIQLSLKSGFWFLKKKIGILALDIFGHCLLYKIQLIQHTTNEI